MLLAKMISWTLCLCLLFSLKLKAVSFDRQIPLFPKDFTHLTKQERALIRDLKLLNYPPRPWKIESHLSETTPYYDVVIIGAGMAGLAAGAALFKEGIFNIQIFDQNPHGYEGPWKTYARMKTLRSHKDVMGPALDIPHLTFHAWFEAQWGAEAWQQLNKIPNDLWMDYLIWYRQTMQLPVKNDYQLLTILPMQDCLELEFQQQSGELLIVKAHKVILATGRTGFGGGHVPAYAKNLPKSLYAHTIEPIDFDALKGLHIGIIGVGASAFDAAATALEKGAKAVDLIMRRKRLPSINKFGTLSYKGFGLGYYQLSDEKRWEFMRVALEPGIPPPVEALKRLKQQKNFYLRSDTTISHIDADGSQLHLKTNQGAFTYDFLILSTGFYINGYDQPAFRHLMEHIALWKDRLPTHLVESCPHFGEFPYLGPSFEFLPKQPKTAPYLKNIYCFNYGAFLSHGLLSNDIPSISLGATRLAQAIAADFFLQHQDEHLEVLKNYHEEDFNPDDY